MANTFRVKTLQAVGTSATKIGAYDVPAATTTTVIGLTVANILLSAITVDVRVYDGANYTHIVKSAPVPVGSSLVVIGGDQKVVLETGMSIDVKASLASGADVAMSILEVS